MLGIRNIIILKHILRKESVEIALFFLESLVNDLLKQILTLFSCSFSTQSV